MFSSIVGLLASIIGGAVSSSANKDYQAELDDQIEKQKVSEALNQAEQIYKEQATRGLPYYEQQKAEIETSIPTTLNQARDYLSGGEMVDALKSIYSNTQQQKRQLDVANAQQRIANQQAYGQFLGSTLAPAQERVAAAQTALSLQKAEAEVTRQQDMLGFANAGAANLDPMNILNLLGSSDLSKFFSLLLAKKKQTFSMDELNPSDYLDSLPKTTDLSNEEFEYLIA